jgi:small-conductance mechanosensitive channel
LPYSNNKSLKNRLLLAISTFFLAVIMSGFAPGLAQEEKKDNRLEDQPGYVYVDGIRVIGVFGSNGPLSKEERIKQIQSRVDNAYGRRDFDPSKFHIVDDEFGTRIFYGEENIMLVANEEAQSIKISSRALATDYIKRLNEAASHYKKDSRTNRLVLGALGSVAGFITLIFLFSRFGTLTDSLSVALVTKLNLLLPGTRTDVLKDFLTLTVSFVSRTAFFVFWVGCLFFYVCTVLNYFPWTKVYGHQLLERTMAPLTTGLHDFSDYIPNFFIILIIGYFTYGALALFHFVFTEIGKGELSLPDFDRDWAEPTYKLIKALTIFMAIIVAAPYLPGWESPAFKQMGLFIGLLVSLGSTGAVGHLVAGVVLTYTRAFKIGDRVKIGEHTGDVIERTLFTTRIKTIKNEAITVHNGQVITSEIINYSTNALATGLILHTSVTIGYDAPWRQVHQLLIDAASDCPDLLTDPKPFVLQRALDDFFVEYEINAYTNKAHEMVRIYSELHQAIQDRFNAAQVEIMSPHYGAIRNGNKSTIPTVTAAK